LILLQGFQPTGAANDHQESHGENASDQKANGQEKEAVDIAFQPAACLVPNDSPERKQSQYAADRQFWYIAGVRFVRSFIHSSYLSSISCSRDLAKHVEFAQLSETKLDHYADFASAFECVDSETTVA